MNGNRGRGRRARQSAPRRNQLQVHPGHFVNGPYDPPPAFKSGWKDIRLEIGIGSTSVTLTAGTIRDTLNNLGITANSYRLNKLSVWVTPLVDATANMPEVIMSVQDPIGKGNLGSREDTGQLSRAAHVHYSYSQTIREIALDFPTAGQSGIELASIATSHAKGAIHVSLAYNI